MATKRRYNGTKQTTGPDAESPFVNIPWGATQDKAFDEWLNTREGDSLDDIVEAFLADGLTVKLGAQGDSRYCTVDSQEARAAGTKHLLSGWSDTPLEAAQIALFKWKHLLLCIWDHPTDVTAKSRRR